MNFKKNAGLRLGAPFAVAFASLSFPVCAFAEGESTGGLDLLIPKLSEFLPALVAFLVIWFVLAKYAWPAITGMLDKRAETIKTSLANAESARIEAQKLLDEYKAQISEARKESGEILAEAKRSAEAVKADITAKAQAEADEIVAKARVAIENEKKQALAELQGSIADFSVSVAGKLIGENLDADSHRQLVEKYIAEVGTPDEN